MATWKKVIVSGSAANLASVQVDNLTSGEVVIGGGSSNLSTTAINGTGNIVATTDASGVAMSGSFSGSFTGTFVGTTDLPDLTQGAGIETFTYDGSTTATVAVSGASALNANTITKWTGDAFANTNITDNGTVVDVNSDTIVSGSLTVTGNVISTGSLKLQPDATDARYLEIYNTSAQDTHITASGGWLFLGDDTTYVKVDNYSTNNLIELKADNGFIVSGATTINGNVIITGSLSNGNNAQAIGAYSLAGGDQTQAIGVASHAEGTYSIASGSQSHAEGSSTTALGVASHAEGSSTTAQGDYSHAEGDSTTAQGNYSHAEGSSTTTQGSYSHAEGSSTTTQGDYSHAEGGSTTALGNSSHAEGDSTATGGTNGYLATSIVSGLVTLSGSYGDVTADYPVGNYLYINDYDYDSTNGVLVSVIDSTTFNGTETEIQLVNISVATSTAVVGNLSLGYNSWVGDQTYRGNYSHAEGYSTQTLGYGAHAEGSGTQAVANSSHAEGYSAIAMGQYSHAEGNGTQTIGQYSHAEGESTQAIGESSHAEGKDTQAIGGNSHAEGRGTQAVGAASHAEGLDTQAIGNYSHAEGIGTIASGSGQLAAGTYNTHNNTTSLVVIGNGVDDNNRSDLALFNPTSITFNAPVTGSTFSGSFVGDGSGLTGLASTLSGSTDSGNFEVNLLNQYLTVQGTANEIEVSGSGQTITIGLPSDVTISNNLTVTGDLIVNGTTTVINTTNTAVTDQFILLASGSTSTIDAGIIVQNAANAGEAFYWENNTAGTSRWAIASNIDPTTTTVTAAEYMVTANTAVGAPSTAPTYGGSSVGYGNMYVDSANGDIYIYS